MTYTVGRDDVKTLGSISYFEAPSMKALGLVNHAFCTRCGGVSHGSYSSLNLGERNGDDRTRVQRNRDLVVKTFDIAPGQLVTMNQMHGDRIWIIDRPLSPSTRPSEAPYDAILTDRMGIAIGVLTADCIPILLVDTRHFAIGIIHAGWRGTLLGIARKALHKMTLHFGTHPEDLLVAIGPSIGECCYEVDEAVMGPFRSSKWNWQAFTRPKGEHKWFMNLSEATIEQMRACGIRDEQCCCIRVCTACNTDMLFSNRVEGPRTGRQISFIQLREDADGA